MALRRIVSILPLRGFESLSGGHHVEWFWDAVARRGEGISAEELAAHVISGGWSPHVGAS
jgi:hypothetical protein